MLNRRVQPSCDKLLVFVHNPTIIADTRVDIHLVDIWPPTKIVSSPPASSGTYSHCLQATECQQRLDRLLAQIAHNTQQAIRPCSLVDFRSLRRTRRAGARQRKDVVCNHLFDRVPDLWRRAGNFEDLLGYPCKVGDCRGVVGLAEALSERNAG